MIAKWGFGPMVARLTSGRNPFHVVSRKQLYESRIFGHAEETRGYPDVFCRFAGHSTTTAK
jgi:hypothetical protein